MSGYRTGVSSTSHSKSDSSRLDGVGEGISESATQGISEREGTVKGRGDIMRVDKLRLRINVVESKDREREEERKENLGEACY
ncbi:hypothetical protein O3M35_009696 [Rhynocoris fuscipes]|uniref:Uncharacterized protein n=1 Tax=Rhynocoris fuscipes TaxID=488301 RepID=A0AAW1D7H1_9HEMI